MWGAPPSLLVQSKRLAAMLEKVMLGLFSANCSNHGCRMLHRASVDVGGGGKAGLQKACFDPKDWLMGVRGEFGL